MPRPSKDIRTSSRKLPRALTEPIVVKHYRPTLVGLSAEEADKKNEEESRRVGELLRDKLELLFQHFSIPRTGNQGEDYCALSLKLAGSVFTGFSILPAGTRRRGRPSEDTTTLLMGLLIDVEEKKRSMRAAGSPVSDAKALAALTKDPRFRGRWSRYTPRRLANLLAEARNPAINPLGSAWNRNDPAGRFAREAIAGAIALSRKTRA